MQAGAGTDAPLISDVGRGHTAHTPKKRLNIQGVPKIIPSQMEVAPLHCTVDITQKRTLFKNTKEIEKM